MKSKPTPYSEAISHEGKLPPQAIQIEEAVLGALITEPDTYWKINTIISKESFYKSVHREIFDTIARMHERSLVVDLPGVYQYAIQFGYNVEPHLLSVICANATQTATIERHAFIVLQYHIKRELIARSAQLYNRAYDDMEDVDDLLGTLEKDYEFLNNVIFSWNELKHVSHSLALAIKDSDKRQLMAKQGIVQGIDTGLVNLNKLTTGWQNGDLIILAARPAMGKTAMMLHHVISAAKAGYQVCVFSLEMSDLSLANRLLVTVSGVDAGRFRSGFMDTDDNIRIADAVTQIAALPIYIDPNPVVSMRYIRSRAKIMKNKKQCDIVFIDYLQLCDMTTEEKGRNREQEVAQTSRMAKIIAKELDVPVILLSQLNRSVESRSDKEPGLADLRESGAIEQDADIVAFLYRPEYYKIHEDSKGNSTKGMGYYIIAKQRNGATRTEYWRYNESLTQIRDWDAYETVVPVGEVKPNTNFNNDPF